MKCDRKACLQVKPAMWTPRVLLYATKLLTVAPYEFRTPVMVCEDCKELIKVDSILSDSVWNKVILRAADDAKKPRPIREFSILMWDPIFKQLQGKGMFDKDAKTIPKS